MAHDEDAVVFVKEGFAWPALFIPALWLPWHGLWIGLTGFVLAIVAISAGGGALGIDPGSQAFLGLVAALAVGLFGNDLRRRALGRRRYVETAVVAARGLIAAERRFFALRSGAADG